VIVETRALTVRYGATLAVDAIDVTASPGQLLAIVGPNGSGKSSLIKAIAGVVPSTGAVRFGGSAVRPRSIAYMAQDIGGRAALTVLEVVLLGRLGRLGMHVGRGDLAAIQSVMARLDLIPFAGRYLGELSGGQRQLVFLAQALASEPQVLLLDEPISALDLRHQLEVLDLVRHETEARGLTTLCVLHDLTAAARVADRIAILRAGKLVADGPLVGNLTETILTEAFDVEVEILTSSRGLPVVSPTRPRSGNAARRDAR
jgi:iron complex transport system ATP-binding protein